MKVYNRTENGTTTQVSVKDGNAEINHAMMEGKRDVREMSAGPKSGAFITYKDGRHVRLLPTDVCGNRSARQVCALPTGHTGYHRSTAETEAWSFRWFDNEGTPAEETDSEGTPAGETTADGKRIVTAKGKRYVVSAITPARPRTPGAKSWVPEAYVRYWSERNGETFGATRFGKASGKPGSVGRAIWDAVN